ncbi:MAG: Spx/MgsR family RNA polymerase-binding regulatory protein [Pseudomonadota bacterium]
MIIIYGLKNCDSCKKAIRWLNSRDVEAELIDIRDQAVPPILLNAAVESFGIDRLINRRSTTWRQLDEQQKTIQSIEDALALIDAYPTLMKRPLLIRDDQPIAIGFDGNSEPWLSLP